MRLIGVLSLVALIIVACSNELVPTPIPATQTPLPTATQSATPVPPTATPEPTASPTQTPTLTPTPEPTLTPTPSPSPTPAIPTPTPVFDPGLVILPTVAIPVRTPTPTPTSEEVLSRKLDAIGFRTSLIRDLSGRGPVERELVSKQELKALLIENLGQNRERVLVAQKLYETLGIIDEGTDLIELIAGVSSDVVIRFFATDFGNPYVLADSEDFQPEDELVVAHEFTHSLQQLHFDTDAIRESISGNSDQTRALNALEEGDASLTHLLYMGEHMEEGEQTDAQNATGVSDVTAFLAAPVVIQQLSLFPYLDGRFFAIDLFIRTEDFEEIDAAYEYVPRSTEQIIHVEKYDAREEPVEVSLPDIAATLGEGWTELDRDTLGELFIRSYLLSGLEAATSSAASAGWGGDQYVLLENEAGQSLFASMIIWDSEDDAAEFYLAYQELVETRLTGTWEEIPAIESTLTMETISQHALINLDGLITVIVLSPDMDTALTAVADIRFASEGQ